MLDQGRLRSTKVDQGTGTTYLPTYNRIYTRGAGASDLAISTRLPFTCVYVRAIARSIYAPGRIPTPNGMDL